MSDDWISCLVLVVTPAQHLEEVQGAVEWVRQHMVMDPVLADMVTIAVSRAAEPGSGDIESVADRVGREFVERAVRPSPNPAPRTSFCLVVAHPATATGDAVVAQLAQTDGLSTLPVTFRVVAAREGWSSGAGSDALGRLVLDAVEVAATRVEQVPGFSLDRAQLDRLAAAHRATPVTSAPVMSAVTAAPVTAPAVAQRAEAVRQEPEPAPAAQAAREPRSRWRRKRAPRAIEAADGPATGADERGSGRHAAPAEIELAWARPPAAAPPTVVQPPAVAPEVVQPPAVPAAVVPAAVVPAAVVPAAVVPAAAVPPPGGRHVADAGPAEEGPAEPAPAAPAPAEAEGPSALRRWVDSTRNVIPRRATPATTTELIDALSDATDRVSMLYLVSVAAPIRPSRAQRGRRAEVAVDLIRALRAGDTEVSGPWYVRMFSADRRLRPAPPVPADDSLRPKDVPERWGEYFHLYDCVEDLRRTIDQDSASFRRRGSGKQDVFVVFLAEDPPTVSADRDRRLARLAEDAVVVWMSFARRYEALDSPAAERRMHFLRDHDDALDQLCRTALAEEAAARQVRHAADR